MYLHKQAHANAHECLRISQSYFSIKFCDFFQKCLKLGSANGALCRAHLLTEVADGIAKAVDGRLRHHHTQHMKIAAGGEMGRKGIGGGQDDVVDDDVDDDVGAQLTDRNRPGSVGLARPQSYGARGGGLENSESSLVHGLMT